MTARNPQDDSDSGELIGRAPESENETISILAIMTAILRRGWLICWAGIVGGIVGVALTVFFGDFKAESSFRPSQSSALSGLASIASELGANIGGLAGSQDEPLEFWAQLLQSRDLLRAVARTTFTFTTNQAQTDTVHGTPIELYDISERTPDRTLLAATKRLDDDISIKTDLTSGVVTVITSAPWRDLAVQLNRELLRQVNRFNLHARQSEAADEAEFAKQRRDSAAHELLIAEDSLRQFLEDNKTYQSSPRLAFDENRLQRRIDLRQQVYVGLAQMYEQARIEAVRNTPVITIMETPEGSAERRVGIIASAVLGALVFGVLTLVWIFIVDALRRRRAQDAAEVDQFVATLRRLVPFHRD